LADPKFLPTYPDLVGKVAVVTGGTKGIGAATCRLLGGQGAAVVVNGRDQAGIAMVVDEITNAGGRAIGVAADCLDYKAIEQMRERVEREVGPADVLIAFAGGFGSYRQAHEIEEEDWRSVIDANLTTTFLVVKSFLPGMIERRRGSIVTMASNAARFLDILTTAPYAAAKAGVMVFSRHVAKEVGPHGVRVNCVAPATVLTDRVRRLMSEERRAEVAALSPLGRLGEPIDVALATLFLASDASAWLTGVTLDVAGGRIML
jgi:3-oxoacyl-[acyl-carrier protein] reductase